MPIARRLEPFGVTIFTEMTELAARHEAINLGQGFPNWDGPDFVKAAAAASLEGGNDQYPASQGIPALRQALADHYGPLMGRELDPAREVTVTSGCTEALAASFLGLVDPGDEIVLIEPYYDAYPVNASLAGAVVKYVTLRAPEFALDQEELRAAFSPRTRAIVVNTPHNPSGRVFSEAELDTIAELCGEYDALAITDEVYEQMVYDGTEFLRLALRDGMWRRTVTLSSLGKTFSLTGWKVGWAIAPPDLTDGIRSAHQFLTFTTPTPVQHGAVAALGASKDFYDDLRSGYERKRNLLAAGLDALGFDVSLPAGTYFLMAGHGSFGFEDDRSFCRHMAKQARVVAIPPSVFYHRPEDGSSLVRFAFCKDEATLEAALERLSAL